ncbi:hypothetical protein BP5796_04782 [Coleophoma crateriformis]|uniref:Sec39 domain-containing protein n=1 Tax=Coleophoma crateriformis TaxID=565419 RepID=A0A3D8SAW4_9HELO|nr:hypothetical protein BP5796_04782 [Coleophoma crateriformis]
MAEQSPPRAKIVLLAVQLTRKSDLQGLRSLIAKSRKVLNNELVLRILLSHLPETLEPSNYVPLIEDLAAGQLADVSTDTIDLSSLNDLSDAEASKKVKKLHLTSLAWVGAPTEIADDPFVLFVMHRALRIDKNTGLLVQLPGLLTPFLGRSAYLRTWTITTVLPMVRFYYEYHPQDGPALTIPQFEELSEIAGIALLLSRTGKENLLQADGTKTVGRDVRGLVGPWLYGNSRLKRKPLQATALDTQADSSPAVELEGNHTGWEETFRWIATQATSSWETAVEAIEEWDGPVDLDLGGLEDGNAWFDDDKQQSLERRYAQAALAAAYLISEASNQALTGVHRILDRIIALLDLDRIPHISAAAALLAPVPSFERDILSEKNTKYLRNQLLDEVNILTQPKEDSIQFLHALLISAYLVTRAGLKCSVRRAGELVLLQDEREQKAEFRRLMYSIGDGPKADDKYWIKTRNEILWLHGWGAEELTEDTSTQGRGIFGLVSKFFIETEILKILLANTRYELARSIYVDSPEQPLPLQQLQGTIIAAAMNAYDNATNPNKTRGGVKKCDDILKAFPDTLQHSLPAKQAKCLVEVTHQIGKYSLTLTKGEPFLPVNLRVHGDPIAIVEKILSQNHRQYTRVDELMTLGQGMVDAGLIHRDEIGFTQRGELAPSEQEMEKQKSIAKRRILGMCIVNALAADDFETAYSYVVTRLKDIASPANEVVSTPEPVGQGIFAELPPKSLDEWSWLAAFQAGKYRRSSKTVKPTHLGNTNANLEIRHLDQRMECLAYALRLAPKNTLQEILNVYRRCEEELQSLIQQEEEEDLSWDTKGDEAAMPGGFAQTPQRSLGPKSSQRDLEEAPMSLFDLSRTSMARAQNSISALALLKSRPVEVENEGRSSQDEVSRVSSPDSVAHIRKRDQLKNAAVGTLASGVGWLIGAPATATREHDDE